MSRTSPPQYSFSSGEISPLLWGRPDYQRHQTGLRTAAGWLPLREGPITRAPGTRHKGNSLANAAGRTISFVFARNDAVVLEFTPLKMRVWRYGVLVGDPAPYELTTPYDADAIARLQWVQSSDVIYLADGVLPIQRLARAALDNWSIADYRPQDGPFQITNGDTDHLVQASAATGTITLTATDPTFTSDMIGGLFSLEPFERPDIPYWTGNTAVSGSDKIRYDGNTYERVAGNGTGVAPPVHLEGVELVDKNTGIKWQFLNDGFGVARITGVTSPTEATADVVRRIPEECVTAGTYLWAEGAWSDKNGYPAAIEIVDQRLAAAATPGSPRTIWFSAIGGFATFKPGVEADDSFAYRIGGSSTQNRILWLKAGKRILSVGTLGQVLSGGSTIERQAIGPTSFELDVEAEIGVAAARPIAPDGRPIFISADGRRLVEIRYSLADDSGEPIDLSSPSSHLGDPGFEEVIWQKGKQRMGWLRRGDGTLAVVLHDPAEEVLGWAPIPVAGGFVESLCAAPNPAGGDDTITMMVRREINGSTVRFIEELAPVFVLMPVDTPVADAEHFFAAVTFDEDPATDTFSVPHLEGEEVYAWTDQGHFGPYTVAAGGAVQLDSAVSKAVIGKLDATHEVEMLDVRPRARDGDTLGRKKRLHGAGGVRVYRTAQLLVGTVMRVLGEDPQKTRLTQIIPQTVMGTLTKAHSGVAELKAETGGHAEEVTHFFQPFGGAPATIQNVTPVVAQEGA